MKVKQMKKRVSAVWMSFLLLALPVLQLAVGGNLALAATGAWTDLTGSESFSNPSSVAVDSSGNVYVTDYGLARVKKLSNGSWTDITGSASFGGAVGVAVDRSGDVYVTDNAAKKIKKLSNGSWTDITGSEVFVNPVGIAVDHNGDVYVTESTTNRIKKFSNGRWADITGSAALSSPFGIAVDGSSNVYVTSFTSNKIHKLSNGSWTEITGSGSFSSPFGIAADGAGDVYVADSRNNKIKKWSNGDWTDITGSVPLSAPWGVAVDSSGYVYVGESGSRKIKKLTQAVVNSVNVSPLNASVMQGESQRLNATVDAVGGAATTVSWSSSDTTGKVAVDSTGKVTVAADAATGDYTITATSTADNSKTGTATITVTAALSYTIAPIENQTLTALTQGYPSDTQEKKTIHVTNTGTGNLTNLSVAASGAHAGDFVITQPSPTLNSGAPATSFTVMAKDGLEAGTYTATITVSADSMVPVTFTATQAVNLPDAPANPQNLVASRGDRQATLTWDTVTGATYYYVYMSTTPGPFTAPSVATVTYSTYQVKNLTNGTAYYFMVKAGNSGGLSAESNQASAIPATVPAAPTNLVAVAGDGRATVTFTAPADNGGSAVTGYEVISSPGNLAVTRTASPVTFAGLTNGTSYTFTVKAINEAGKSLPSAASNAVTPQEPSSDSDNNSGGNTPSKPTKTPENTGVDIWVNGKMESVGTVTSTKRNAQTVTTVAMDQKKLNDKLSAEGQHAVVTVVVNTKSDVAVGELNGQMVKDMASKQAVLEIKTERGTYSIPAQQINMDAISEQVGQSASLQDIKVQVEIAATAAETLKTVENAAVKGSFKLVAPPLNFTVRATYGDKTTEVSKFNAYVERTIAIPNHLDPKMITTGVIVEADGTIRHVPTKLVVIDGKTYAKVYSLTNSTYSVVQQAVEFADVAQHWAKDAVNDMASRMVVSGVDTAHYQPDAAITRAEFAAIIVRALGLADNEKISAFGDVGSGDWSVGAVAKAKEYGIIQGYEDGTFRPSHTITRQEAMAMMVQAMKWTGLEASVSGAEAESALASYSDGTAVDAWAKQAVAAVVKSGLVQGSDAGLMPTSDITRAETAAIIQRMLEKAKLIGDRTSK
jgi:hypothetical protein